ncbi:hypothetical protein Q9966_006532 [Columba livia]|nr:hypothetical protein Q9966_006532 [Columba livia]
MKSTEKFLLSLVDQPSCEHLPQLNSLDNQPFKSCNQDDHCSTDPAPRLREVLGKHARAKFRVTAPHLSACHRKSRLPIPSRSSRRNYSSSTSPQDSNACHEAGLRGHRQQGNSTGSQDQTSVQSSVKAVKHGSSLTGYDFSSNNYLSLSINSYYPAQKEGIFSNVKALNPLALQTSRPAPETCAEPKQFGWELYERTSPLLAMDMLPPTRIFYEDNANPVKMSAQMRVRRFCTANPVPQAQLPHQHLLDFGIGLTTPGAKLTGTERISSLGLLWINTGTETLSVLPTSYAKLHPDPERKLIFSFTTDINILPSEQNNNNQSYKEEETIFALNLTRSVNS